MNRQEAAEKLGAELRRVREAKGLRRWEVAKLTGLTIGTVYEVEKGRRLNPRLSTILAIAEALEMGPEVFEVVRWTPGQGYS